MTVKQNTVQQLIKAGVDCLNKLPDDIAKAQTYSGFASLQASVDAQQAFNSRNPQ